MDKNTPLLIAERSPTSTVNGSPRRMATHSPGTARPMSVVDAQIVQLVVHRDEKGYGMKVSGDNPVYVQSVKEGGPAEKAGLHAGDKILKVNGITVITFTHTDVVDLIKSSSQVVLTVQQRTSRSIMSPLSNPHVRPSTAHASTTITNPQPVDNIIQMQLQAEKEQHYRLMIEKEQRYIDVLRSQLATTPDEKKFLELTKTEKNLQTLQSMLQRNQSELPHCDSTSSPISPEIGALSNGNSEPPPLPKRNNRFFGNSATNKRSNTFPLPSHPDRNLSTNDVQVDNPIYYPPTNEPPPPLPPRRCSMPSADQNPSGDAANSINKQMSYPLVATCATLVNNYVGNSSHQRTKSSPESLLNLSPATEASARLINSESMIDIRKPESWDGPEAPPGTPPPPYPSPRMERKNAPDDSDGRNVVEIHAASSQVAQQPIISMEDDEVSDLEMEQPEEHSPFKSLSRLWENPPHLAVFTNYILSNADPNSLLFYLLTDLYKEGNAKEMKKWAFEIHSTFLVPGAPLRLGNVDENVAREIDDVLMKEYDKEEILRKIFWKARARAKEELGRQLADFKQKRTAGLGTIYGPTDAALSELYHDKSKELKLYESLFVEKLEPYLAELDKENYEPKKFYTAAALTTVLQRVFGLRLSLPMLERCPVFVNKEKSFKNKFLPGRYSRKLSIQGHQFTVQQYYTVILCNNCHQIIYGIGPQGYRCSDCNINLHRQCVKLYDDSCPGPVNKKDRGLGKILRIRPHESDQKRKSTNNFIHMERERRQAEEKDLEGNDIVFSRSRTMWSKQADVSNKNATSFKNRITNRKQRVSKSSAANNNGVSPSATTEVNNKLNICSDSPESTEKTKQKSKKNRKNSSCKTLQDETNTNTTKSKAKVTQNNNKNKTENKTATKCTEPNVVLRNVAPPTDLTQKNVKDDVIKRFSDSYIVENGRDVKKSCDIVDGAIPHCDKGRKNRRFSDLFKTSSTFSGSVEDFKLLPDKVLLRQHSELNLKRTEKNEMAKSTNDKNCTKEVPNSYLKRVKSKIYKSSKSETPKNDKKAKSAKNRDSGIPEECEVELKKSSSNFDFRLLRQTSNLEGIWPLRRHCEEVDDAKAMDTLFVKPTLEKAKSSSAINLNLLRTRRNKIMEQVKKRNCQEAKNEFEFVGFGNAIHDSLLFSKRLSSSQTYVGDTSRRLPPSWMQETIGESKPSQPVSRSGSDRRPDSVREESGAGKNHDGQAGGLVDSVQDKDDSPVESSVSLPSSGHKKRNTTNINRSESVKEQSEKQRKQRRNISDPSQNTSSSHDIEQNALSNTTDSGSSSNSNSSISFNGRLSESPSNPNDSLRGNKSDGDSDMDADSDHINWQDLISTEQLNNLPPHEKKRQDVINELFYTEKSHMRSLNVLHKIFYKPLQKSQVLKPEELSLIFPNIKELLQIHRQFNHEMTQKRREDPIVRNLGDLLLNMFSGNTGEAFKEAAAKFCERQQLALELIKERRKRDSKFESILTEGEKKRQCRRLQFQAILPAEMQRLSKLPLLLERLIGAVQEGNGDEEELGKLNKAYQLSKEIVNHVNEAAKMALNQARLEEIQRHLDQSNFERSNDPISQEFRPLDLTKYKLVREGPMHLRRPNKSSVLVHVLLMEEVVVILHKEGDKYVLKNFHSGTSGQTNPLSPIIKISTLLVRINAVCKNALFLVNTSTMNSQMYDLRAEDDAKRDVWFKHFSDVTDAHNKKEGKTRRPESTPDNDDEESVQEFPQPQDVSERAEEVDHVENEEPCRPPSVSDANGGAELEGEAPIPEEQENRPEIAEGEGESNTGVPSTVTAEEWPLIQPSQVHIAVLPVHTAESRLTPIEQVRRKDEEVRRALKEKENLIADLLSIPQQEFHTIADMVSEDDHASDCINLTVASIYQTNSLLKIINDSLNLSDESGVVQATGGQHVSCSSQTAKSNSTPSIPVQQVQDIVNRLSKHLTELLDKQKQSEDEKSLLRNELFKTREKLHDQLSMHDSSGSSSVLPDASTLENTEEVENSSETIAGS